MRYLVTTKEKHSPFITDWFDPQNFFNEEMEMIVYDLANLTYTTNGETWHEIEQDHL